MDVNFKPYLIRAVYDWCTDYGHEPYLVIAVDNSCTVPMAHVQKGQIVLDVSPESIKDLDIALDSISFKARFSGVVHEIYAPMHRIIGIFPTHDQQLGAFFEPTDELEQELNLNQSKTIQPIEKNNVNNNVNNLKQINNSLAKSRIMRVK